MSRLPLACTALLLTLAACGSKIGTEGEDTDITGGDGSGDGTSDGSDGGDGSGDFSPTEGHYNTVTAVNSDTCGMSSMGGATDGAGGFTLTHDGGADWTLTTDATTTDTGTSGGTAIACTLSGHDLTCGPSNEETSFADLGMDATLVLAMTLQATFASSSDAGGTATYDATCTGADCATLSMFGITLPCAYVLDFTATAG